jgi:hypothetical protein
MQNTYYGSQNQTVCRLPNELLLLVKEHIPVSDLRTHVCYYLTCRTIAAFYGDNSQQAAFWRRSCCLAGIGWLKADSSWKEIAFETIAMDGFCPHPHCGGTLLDWNGKFLLLLCCEILTLVQAQRVESAMRRYNWDPEDGAWDANFDPENAEEWVLPGHPIPVFNYIFRHVKFKSQHLPPWFHDPHDAKFRADGEDVNYQRALTSHPVAIRSLATFPSVRRLNFLGFSLGYEHRFDNALGLTVWDILRGFQSE